MAHGSAQNVVRKVLLLPRLLLFFLHENVQLSPVAVKWQIKNPTLDKRTILAEETHFPYPTMPAHWAQDWPRCPREQWDRQEEEVALLGHPLWARHFIYIASFNPHNHPCKWILLFPLYRWENGVSEKVRDKTIKWQRYDLNLGLSCFKVHYKTLTWKIHRNKWVGWGSLKCTSP